GQPDYDCPLAELVAAREVAMQRANLHVRRLLLAVPIFSALYGERLRAANLYWDINGANTGGSDTTSASGTWDGINAFWNTDSAGTGAGTFNSEVAAG